MAREQSLVSLAAVRVAIVSVVFVPAAIGGCTTSSIPGIDAGPEDAGTDAYVAPDAGSDSGPVMCPPGEIDCGGVCTQVAGDALNCGSCGNVCPEGIGCAAGRCICEAPMVSCNGVCRDLTLDPDDCGACGNACGPLEMCSDGECIVACSEPDRVCANRDEEGVPHQVCADLQTDPINCGACNTRCAGGSECIEGRCRCPADELNCGGMCVPIQTDPLNCGSCRISCGADGTCEGGRCTACGAGLTDCTGRCVDVSTDRFNCGSCGRGCGSGEACVGGLCECSPGLIDCGTGCTDLATDVENCGTCGTDCGRGGVCSGGVCTCATGLTMCGASCADLVRDESNCGTCGTACGAGEVCSRGTCGIPASFRVTSFGTTNCRTIQHDPPTGDDRGGIAVSPAQLFISGDSVTARMDAGDLTGLASVGTVHDALVSDLETEQVYVLLDAAGTQPNGTATITQLGLVDGTTGALTATRVPLDTPIPVEYDTGIFAGWGGALIAVPVGSSLQWWHIELASGTVTRLGDTQDPTRRFCETWAWWGVAEYFGGAHHATYVESSTRIVRLDIPASGMTSAPPVLVSSFTNLGDMCSITLSPSRERWYFHHEYDSQFSATPSGEIGGSCDSTHDFP